LIFRHKQNAGAEKRDLMSGRHYKIQENLENVGLVFPPHNRDGEYHGIKRYFQQFLDFRPGISTGRRFIPGLPVFLPFPGRNDDNVTGISGIHEGLARYKPGLFPGKSRTSLINFTSLRVFSRLLVLCSRTTFTILLLSFFSVLKSSQWTNPPDPDFVSSGCT
jgi:hypothetical protein